MTVGKKINVVLSLDDAAFTARIDAARTASNALKASLGEFGKVSDQLDKTLTGLSGNVGSFSKVFAGLQASLKATSEQMQKTATEGFERLDKAQKSSATTAQ